MRRFIATVNLGKEWERTLGHDPRNKKIGVCPVSGVLCTDITGAHHSFIVEAAYLHDAWAIAKSKAPRVTRLEEI